MSLDVSVHISSGEKIQIGQINLDIQLTVNSSYLKPRIEELFNVFSKELDIKPTQVSLTDKHTIACNPFNTVFLCC